MRIPSMLRAILPTNNIEITRKRLIKTPDGEFSDCSYDNIIYSLCGSIEATHHEAPLTIFGKEYFATYLLHLDVKNCQIELCAGDLVIVNINKCSGNICNKTFEVYNVLVDTLCPSKMEVNLVEHKKAICQ